MAQQLLAAATLLAVMALGLLPKGTERLDKKYNRWINLFCLCIGPVTESIAVDGDETVMCYTGTQCELDGVLIQERHGDDTVRAADCCTSLQGSSLRTAPNGESGGQCLRCLSAKNPPRITNGLQHS